MICCRYIPYTLTLESPAIVSAPGGDPNSSKTLPFIPGSALRGAVAAALGDPGGVAARQAEFNDLVLNGTVRYLNAYPALEERRSLPLPVSFYREKDAPNNHGWIDVIDLSAYEGTSAVDEDLGEVWPDRQLAAIGERFVTVRGSSPTLVTPLISARTHHQRDRRKGRPWKDASGRSHGAVFTFEFLDAGQSFEGLIQVWGNDDRIHRLEERVKELLRGTVLVGRSRRAGYGGKAAIIWKDSRTRETGGSGSDGLQPLNRDLSAGEQFRLLLTSACVVADPLTGHPDPSALEVLLQERFRDRARLVGKRWAFETVGGFNQKWRLELPQSLAASPGSIFVFEALSEIPLKDLLDTEHRGVGERREEGFGRLLFLNAPVPRMTLFRPEAKKKEKRTVDAQPPELALEIERRIMDTRAVRAIEQTAAAVVQSPRRLPSNSLIGRLRVPLRRPSKDAVRTLERWLNGGNESERLKAPAMDQLAHCRVRGEEGESGLKDWLLHALKDGPVRSMLNYEVLAQQSHVVSIETAKRFLEERSEEYKVRLIDAVLAGLALRNKKERVGYGPNAV
jgi:CRISPR-associated protein Csx10